MARVRAYVGLGANVGDVAATLGDAVHALAALPGARLRGVSRLYATEPVGVLDQPEFRNACVALDLEIGPDPVAAAIALLVALKGLERAFGRQPRGRWGPREVDLDLLVFGRHRVDVPRPPEGRSEDPAKAALPLVVPHAEARNRLFVLAPLSDLAPGLVPPGWGETVATAAARRRRVEGSDAARPIASWGREGWRPPERPTARDSPPGQQPGSRAELIEPTAGPPAADRARTCGPCPRSAPAWSGRPSPASGSAPRRRRTAHPGAARRR